MFMNQSFTIALQITNLKSEFVLPGNPCHDYLGYCDALGECQMIDMDGPFKTLIQTFFSYAGKPMFYILLYISYSIQFNWILRLSF